MPNELKNHAVDQTHWRIVRCPEALALLGCKRAWFHDIQNPRSKYYDPTFPKRIRLSSSPRGAVGWLLHELEAWVAQKAAQRFQSTGDAK